MFSQEKFSERLRILRKEKKLTQKELAEQLGVSEPNVSLIEQGRRAGSIQVVAALADLFDVSIDYLVGSSNNRARNL